VSGAESQPKKNVLIVAFQFPPFVGSSGPLRALKFCRYLPEFGWSATVLTAAPRAYEARDDRELQHIPAGVNVIRAFGLDARRHLSIKGRYPQVLALPDRWVSWCLAAVPVGLREIRRRGIDVIFTTFPIASAVLIGAILHWLTGRSWVVDFRDPMIDENYPHDALTRTFWHHLEKFTARHADRLIFNAPSLMRLYRERYPERPSETFLLIPNGYDEEDFDNIHITPPGVVTNGRPLRLLHAGFLHPSERDPSCFFRALARLKRGNRLSATQVQVVLRAPGFEDEYSHMIRELEINDLVKILDLVPHREALQDCAQADGLLLFQAARCNRQVPAKAFEYLRLRKPVFVLTSHAGDTAALFKEVGGATVVDIASEEEIYQALPRFLQSIRDGSHPLPDIEGSARFARRNQAADLARCFAGMTNAESPKVAENLERVSH
jgi:glycosyltransferase involved in cell wall biosynthesis